MRDSGIKIAYDSYIEDFFNEFSHPDHENSPCQGIENVSIFVNKKRWKKRKKHDVFEHAQPPIAFRLSRLSKPNEKDLITRHSSMPELSKCTRLVPPRIRSGHGNGTKYNNYKQNPFQSKFIANVFSEHRFDNWFLNPNYPSQTKWKIYRCQLGAVEDSCCCSCNSDAMFEVMKGLYDCYKAKNCDGCDCVLCGYKTKEERAIGELRKSMTSAAREKVLEGKTPEEKEFILKEMAKTKQALPSGKTASDKALIDKVRQELGLPPTPKTASEKAKMRKAEAAGIITPLEGKTPEEKEKILRAQADMGLRLPEGRTDSEKALIEKIKAKKKRSAKSALLTPLSGKTPEEKERILRGRAMKGLPLPEAQTPSEKKLIAKVRADLGLPKEPTTKSLREKYDQAAKAGLLQPLEGKTPEEKEKTLKGLRSLGIPLPEGRTPSEKALIAKVKASPRSLVAPSEQLRRAKAEGLITPLTGKTPEQKEKIIKGLAMKGLPLPEATTASEKKLIDKVRADLGLPKEPTTKSLKDKFEKAAKAGLLQPLEGMTPEEKEKTLKGLHDLGIPLPEGRTPSEKALVAKVKSTPRAGSIKTAGMMTPLTGKPPEQKEKILRKRAMKGIPLPEGVTPSEKQLVEKVRADLGLPPEPTTKSLRDKHDLAAKAGLLEPLEGKTPAQKEAQLKGLRDLGIPLPEGRTPSEKALIAKVKGAPRSLVAPSEQLRRAKAEGLMTPLTGKTPAQKEKILKGLAMKGLPLPEGKTPSERKLIDKVRDDLGLPKEPDTKSMKEKYDKAAKAGLLQPLLGKTPEEKEKILQGQYDLGIPLPEGRTPSERALINKIKAVPAGSIKTAGVMTPLTGKTPAQKEKLLRARAMKGIPLPEGVTPSEKKMIDKVRADLGLPAEPTTKSLRDKHELAAKAGLLAPLEGKTPAQKEAQLKGLRDMGIPLPEGRTPSEKALIAKVKGAPRSLVSPSEQFRRAKAEGLITPLTGKTPSQKEKILKGLAMKGLPLPEGKTPSERKLIDKVRDDLGLPKEPDTKSMKEKYDKAAKAGLLQPLLGKTPEEKEKILQGQYDLGIPLPEGRTPSERAIINKIKALPAGSIKTAGVMTPLTGKTPAQKEKLLRARAMKGIPLPEGVTPSEKKMIDKVRADLGLPAEPTTKSLRDKHELAAKAGLLAPLEGKTPAQKEAILKGLRDMGIPLPEGRTPSEKALISKVTYAPKSMVSPSEQLRRAKAEGLMTPLAGKTPAQKEKILKGLAMKGIPLPEGKTPSEKKLIDKVRDDLGLPKEPDTKSMKEKYDQAAKAGLLKPLLGKTPEEKEKILQGLRDLGVPLPEGRTPSEKALISKIKAAPPAGSIKTAGLMTPLTGKSPAHKEKVLRARAMKGIPLPEGVTPSEKKIIDKVRADLGLPAEPTTKSLRDKHEQAAKAGLLEPLEGKTPAQKEAILKGLRDMGIPLPEGRTPSEKALVAKVKGAPRSLVAPSEQLRRAKAEGLMTPLTGKTPAQKEKILKGLAMKGLPLPEGKTPSEKKLIDKVRDDLGLPKEPDTKSMKEKYDKAAKAGFLQPLLGKTPEEKEKILQGQYDLGIPLPEGRTPSEKAIINKIKALPAGSIKTAGVMTPLTGKSPAQKEKVLRARAMKGIPLPEGVTPSEKKIIDKVRADLGLPAEPTTKSLRDKHEQAAKLGLLEPLEGKTPAQKEALLKGLRDMGIPLPEGRTPSEKALVAKVKGAPRSLVSPSEQLRRAKAEGLMTPLAGKTPAQKEKILKGLAMKGIPLPEGKTPSEKKLIDKVRDDLGIPKEPDTKSMKEKYDKAAKAGLLQPLAGKTPEEKEKILQAQRDLGIPLPEGRTPSEKALIAKIKAAPPSGSIKTAGLMTPLIGKSPAHKEKVLRARAMKGIPLPEGVSPSEKKIIDKVRADLGLPAEPTTKSLRDKHEQAAKAGLLEPLEGKTPAQKEAILKGLRDMGIPLPEGRTPSEKALVAKVKGAPRSLVAPSEQLRRAKAEGLMTPLTGKTPAQKEKILKGLAMKGLPLPEGKTPSEKKLIDKVRDDLGLPKEPDTKSMKEKYDKAAKAGLLQPLLGKTPEEKEKILQGQYDLGIPLPEGRTPSEKALINKIKAVPAGSIKTAGLMTPLTGKTPAQKEKVLRARAMKGIPLPEGVTPSEKKIVDKVRADLGLPPEPTTKSLRDKHEQAAKAGLLEPLEGKTPAQKEAQLKGLRDMGIPLPEGRTPSEKALIAKVKGTPRSLVAPSEQLRRAKAEGLMTPLTGKTPAQKEKILKGLAMKGLPLPEGKTPSEKKLIDKVRDDLGIPKEPDTKSMKEKYDQAAKAGLLQPLAGKTPEEKEKILQAQHDFGLPLPEGRTPSEKALIAKVKAAPRLPASPSEQMRRAKTEGLLTPLKGKTPEQKEKILKGLAMKGLPLPEPQTPSEKKLVDKVRAELGLPKEPTTKALREKYDQAAKAGLLEPLEGKTPEEKEKTLKGLQELGIPLPEGRTPSEKALIAKVKASVKKAESVPSITTEKIKKAKAAGLFTPLKGKTPEQKEKILKGLAKAGLPLPEGKTPSDMALIDQVKKEFGIPERTPSEKLRRAKAAGLLTPLEGKTKAQKEKILRGRADAGLPLPMGKTPSERALIKKIKDQTGYVTPSPSERLQRAKAAGLLTPLKGKSPSVKEKILQGMKAAGVPIPEGETPSEKKLISKLISKPKVELEGVPSDKVRAAKAAGLLTPLEGKTPSQKEKILKGLAEAGLPLPEGKTKSEKSMIAKIKARTPPEGTTPSEKSIIGKAKAAGLFTPITGKAPAEKERILRGLAEAGLPLPEGKTASEKDLVKKIRAEAGLPLEATPSEKKGKIRKKAKKVGVSASKKAAGISAEEFEDVIKTTKCDRGCGCDRKKIRFKHSYVKIRVTSPDISSFCDCPGECFPQVKNGAFIDNDGIKVTVGSAVGIPSYSMVCINPLMPDAIVSHTDGSTTQANYKNTRNFNVVEETNDKVSNFESGLNNNKNKRNDKFNVTGSDISYSSKIFNTRSENNVHSSKAYRSSTSLKDLTLLEDIYKEPLSNTKSASSFDTILIIRNDMSLSTSTSNSMETISLTSVMNSSITSSSAHYSGYQSTNDLLSMNSLDGLTTSDDFIDHAAIRGRNAVRNIAASQRYTILRTSQIEDNFGNNKVKKTMKRPETDDPIVLFKKLPTELDVSKIMFKIMSKKRYAGASSIFIVVPNSEDEHCSMNCADSITSLQSSECRFTTNTTSFVDPDPALRPRFTEQDERDCRKGKTFYLQEIPCHSETETMNQNESEPDLRRIGMTKDEVYQNSRSNEIAEMLQKAGHNAGTDRSADRPSCSRKDYYTSKNKFRRIAPLFLQGKSLSWLHFKKSTEPKADEIFQCVGPSFSPVPSCTGCLQGRCEQQQTTMSSSVCGCSPDELNWPALVQKPEPKRHECSTMTKKSGLAWFRSGWRKASASSSGPGCNIPLCFDLSSTSYNTCQECLSQQQQAAATLAPDLCLSNLEVSSNPSVKVGNSYSWFRKLGKRKAYPPSDLPPSGDYSFCPSPPHQCYHHGYGQQNHNRTNPLGYSKGTRNPTAKVGKSYSWFHLPGKRKAKCYVPTCCDYRYPPPSPYHSCQQGRDQHGCRKKCPRDDLRVTTKYNPPAKPCRESPCHQRNTSGNSTGRRFCLSGRRKVPVKCDNPPPCKPRDIGSSRCQQPLVNSNRHDTAQKPCTESIPQETTPKITESSKWLTWIRLPGQCKKSAPSIPTSSSPQCQDSSCSPVRSEQLRHLGGNQQNQTSKLTPPCVNPPGELPVKNPTDQQNQPSTQTHPWVSPPGELPVKNKKSHQNQTSTLTSPCVNPPGELPVKNLTDQQIQPSTQTHPWVNPPGELPVKNKKNHQNQTSTLTSPCVNPPGELPVKNKKNHQNQTSTLTSPCVNPPGELPVKNLTDQQIQPSTQTLPWVNPHGELPVKNLTDHQNQTSKLTPPCVNPPGEFQVKNLTDQQNQPSTQTPPCVNPPGDVTVKNRTAKVQKPSLESACHEDETTPRQTVSRWFIFPRGTCTRHTSVTLRDAPQRLDFSCSPVPPDQPRHLDFNQQNQTSVISSCCCYSPDDLTERNDIFPRGTCTCQTSVQSMTLREIPQHLDSSCSPLSPDQPRHLHFHQQNQTSATPGFCSYPPDDFKVRRRPSDVSLSWSLTPRGTCTRKTSVPSIVMREVPQYHDSSCSPLPPERQNQATEASPLCAYSPDVLKVKRRRSGKRISWSRLPNQCKTPVPATPTRSAPRHQDSSTSPVPPDHLRTCDLSQQCQTFAYPSHPEDLEGRRTRTAKVQKPSLQSLYHEDQTTSKRSGLTVSWSLLPSKRKTLDPAKATDGLLQFPRLHGRNERTQTPESFWGYPSYDLQEMRNLSVHVQKPSVEIISQDQGFHHKNAGIMSNWFRLPSTLMASVKVFSTLEDRQNPKTRKPHIEAFFESNPEPNGQTAGSPISQKILATKQKYPKEICCPFRKQNLIYTEPADETVLPGSSDQQPGNLANDITPLQQKLVSLKTVDQKGDKVMSQTEFDPKTPRTKRESKEDKPNTITLPDSKLISEKITQPEEKIFPKQKVCRPCPKQNQIPQPELTNEATTQAVPIDQQLEKITKELTLVQQKLASIETIKQKEYKPMSHIKLDNHKHSKGKQTNGVSKEDKQNPNTDTFTETIPLHGDETFELIPPPQKISANTEKDKPMSHINLDNIKHSKVTQTNEESKEEKLNPNIETLTNSKHGNKTFEPIPQPQQMSENEGKVFRETCCPFRKQNLMSQPDITKEIVKLPGLIDLQPTQVANETKTVQQKRSSSKNVKQNERKLMCGCKEQKQHTITLSDLKPEPVSHPISRHIPQAQEIPAGEQKAPLAVCRPCPKQNLMSQTKLSKEVLELPDAQTEKQPDKLANEMTPFQQTLASTKTIEQKMKESKCKSKEDKAVGTIEMKTKVAKLFGDMKKNIIPKINDTLKCLAGQKETKNPEYSSTIEQESPELNKKKGKELICEDKPMSTKRLYSPETRKHNGREVICECKEDKPMGTTGLNSPGTTKQRDREVVCECKEGILMSNKGPTSPGTRKKTDREEVCKCKESKPMGTEGLNSPGTMKQWEREVVCECKEGKPMGTKGLNSPGTRKQKDRELACGCKEGKPVSTKGLISPGTREQKNRKEVCECKDNKLKQNIIPSPDLKPEQIQPISGHIPQSQDIPAIEQKAPLAICCPCPKPYLVPQQEFTEEVEELSDSQIEQQLEKVATEITPVQQKLASTKTVEQKTKESKCKCEEDKTMNHIKLDKYKHLKSTQTNGQNIEDKLNPNTETLTESIPVHGDNTFEPTPQPQQSSQDPKTPITTKESKEDGPNTVALSDLKLAAKKSGRPLIFEKKPQPEEKILAKQKVCRPCPKESHEWTLIQQKLKSIKTIEQNKLKQNNIPLSDLKPEPVSQPISRHILQPQEIPDLELNTPLGCSCPKQNLMPQPELTKEVATQAIPTDQQLEINTKQLTLVQQNLASIKIIEQKEDKPMSHIKLDNYKYQNGTQTNVKSKEDKLNPNSETVTTTIPVYGDKTFEPIPQSQQKSENEEKVSRETCCPFRKQNPISQLDITKELILPDPIDVQPTQVTKENIKPVQQKLPNFKNVEQNERKRMCGCKENKLKQNKMPLSDLKTKPARQTISRHILQPQEIPAIELNTPLEICRPCPKPKLMHQPVLAKEVVELPNPQIEQPPEKLANEMTPCQQKLASIKTVEHRTKESKCICKEDKAVSPKEMKTKVGKLFVDMKNIIIPKINGTLKCLAGQKEPNNPEYLSTIEQESPETNKKEDKKLICEYKEGKPMSNKELNSSGTGKQKDKEVACECENGKPGSIKVLNSSAPINQRDREVACECEKGKPGSIKVLNSPAPINQRDREVACECKEGKPMSTKVLNSPAPINQRDREVACECEKGKPGSIKVLNSPAPINQRDREVACECEKGKPGSIKVLNSPAPINQRDREVACECKEGKPLSTKVLNSPVPINQRDREVACECEEGNPMSTKVLNSPVPINQRDREVACECKEGKPMSTKVLNSPVPIKQRDREVACECIEGKPVTCKCEKHATEQLPLRQKRCPPMLPPVLIGLPPAETPEGRLHEGIGPSCKWLDTGVFRRLRSELTHSTSGFKACKKRKLQKSQAVNNIELDFGDAIRYYASINPERFQQLIQEELKSQRKAEEDKLIEEKKLAVEMEKARKKTKKEAKTSKVDKTTSVDQFPISGGSESDYPQGFKFSIVVKDGPTALAGVDCIKKNRQR